jgi:hypothetical protein
MALGSLICLPLITLILGLLGIFLLGIFVGGELIEEIVAAWRDRSDRVKTLAKMQDRLAEAFLEALANERQNTMEEVGSWYEPGPPGR